MSDESLLDKAFAAPEPPTNLGEGNRLVPGELLSGLRHDMRTPIQYALSHPARPAGVSRKLDLASIARLEFALEATA